MRYLIASCALLPLVLICQFAHAAAGHTGNCRADTGEKLDGCIKNASPIASCTDTLADRPAKFSARLALCQAFMNDSRYEEALKILTDGEAVHRRDSYILNKIKVAQSNVRETSRPVNPNLPLDTVYRYLVIRCTSTNNLDACNDALAMRRDNAQLAAIPQDPKVHATRGTILAKQALWVESILALRVSLRLDGSQSAVRKQLADVSARRETAARSCLDANKVKAITPCILALLPGASDEYQIQAHIGDLELQRVDDMELLSASDLDELAEAYNSAAARYRRSLALQANSPLLARVDALEAGLQCLKDRNVSSCQDAGDQLANQPALGRLDFAAARRTCELLAAPTPAFPGALGECTKARDLTQSTEEKAPIALLITRLQPPQNPYPKLRQACLRGAVLKDCLEARPLAPGAADVNLIAAAIDRLKIEQLVQECIALEQASGPAAAEEVCSEALVRAPGNLVAQGVLARAQAVKTERRCRDESSHKDIYDAISICRDAVTNQLTINKQQAMRERVTYFVSIRDQDEDRKQRQKLAETCLNADTSDMERALTLCSDVLEKLDGEPGLQAQVSVRITELEKARAPYSNKPLEAIAGVEIITY